MLSKRQWIEGNGSILISFLLSISMIAAIWPQPGRLTDVIGRLIIISSCYLVLYLFLYFSYSEILRVTRKVLFMLFIMLSFIVLTRLVRNYKGRDLLPLVPFVMVPVVIRTFYDARLALYILFMTILLTGFFVPDPFEFAFMNFIAGVTAIYTLSNMHGKVKILVTVIIVVVNYSLVHTGFHLMNGGSFSELKPSDFLFFMGNGLLVLLGYPLIFLFEKRFQFISDTTLLELSDTNQQLLRKLAEEAPGSFQHSIQVANLAEEAARITGANPLLVRAGALYHDVGKIGNPGYYTENQKQGMNPHDDLDPTDSARVIINHVTSGVILAKNYKLPEQIIDFIRTHHGTSISYYFYRKFTDLKPWECGREKEFTYPGPKPGSKETAIVMMADAVEASSRSLEKPTDESINDLVERIILLQEEDDQFTEVPFTFKDISDIKEAFKRRLSTIYHARIAYPEREL